MLWESVTDSCDVCQCTRLFKNVFKIKGTPEGIVKSKLKARRMMTMASRHLSSPDLVHLTINKENGSAPCSPLAMKLSPLTSVKSKTPKSRCPLEDFDPNSQDSGYGAGYQEPEEGFRFVEPSGVAPRRMSMDSRSPQESPVRSFPGKRRIPFLNRLSSEGEGMDDGFNELLDAENFMDNPEMPNGLNDLISGEIFSMSENPMELDASTTPEFPRTRPTGVRRSLSLQNDRMKHDSESGTPPISKVRSCLFRSPNATSSASKLAYNDNKPRSTIFSSPESPAVPFKSFKRPDPPTDASPVLVKRCKKSSSLREFQETPVEEHKSSFPKYHSEPEAHAHIKSAIHRSTTDSDLTGDFSKPCILPLAEGHHEDLKSISTDTLAALIRGEFKDSVDSFKIVDCRYPYEFEAGHIKGAINLYTRDLIEEYLMNPITHTPEIQPDTNKRRILVFHCEFSWERGPNLSRYLRNIDRKLNKEHYPALHYPEIYLLHGGYQQFYRAQKELCTPQGYRSMTHPDHEADLRKFRSKSKSWQGEKSRTSLISRANLKRLGL
ncbi:M-phase inducer phosphatase-like isoform X2 [Chelonus insularis]|uniref:M-phase inducer phosphatase-like isoform X2 n=1 Tax=Chelonus insularis TaxID=460826 RepID=UPI00158AA583|nr:M-phase inducer phosphatase-like isoform X2 [Chelonus insularis]